jgi:hypothetical protein
MVGAGAAGDAGAHLRRELRPQRPTAARSIHLTASPTPSSARIWSPSVAARLRMPGSDIAAASDAANRWAVSCRRGMGAGPAPSSRTRRAQKDWSPWNGTTIVGMPARRLAAVVPAPPWWAAAATRQEPSVRDALDEVHAGREIGGPEACPAAVDDRACAGRLDRREHEPRGVGEAPVQRRARDAGLVDEGHRTASGPRLLEPCRRG